MATQKLYAGAKLREVRRRLGLSQRVFSSKLGVSLPYLNQMENNHRPVSAAVVLGLAREFGLDVTELAVGEGERLVSDMREALADPVFTGAPPLADLRLAASNAPALAQAFLDLHRAYRQSHERLASLDEALGREPQCEPRPGMLCATSFTIALRRRGGPRRRTSGAVWRGACGWTPTGVICCPIPSPTSAARSARRGSAWVPGSTGAAACGPEGDRRPSRRP